MRIRILSITALAFFLPLYTGCLSQIVKNSTHKDEASEIATSGDMVGPGTASPAMASDIAGPETPADIPDYSEEKATLSAISNQKTLRSCL